MRDRETNLKYIVLQGLYWMLYCVGAGFISFYLQGNGFNNSLIGIVTAIFCLVAVILQPIAGNICDRIEILTWKKLIIIIGVPYIIICIMMLIIRNRWVIAVLFGFMYLITSIYLPLINTALFAYGKEGTEINFGVARGCGSAAYAVMALIVGNMAVSIGTKIIPSAGAVIAVLFLALVSTMPDTKKTVGDGSKEHINVITFVRKYPYFSIMLLAVLFIFFSHNIIGTFLLQIIQSLGGSSADLGKAMFIQALVEIPILFTFSHLMRRIRVGSLMIIAGAGYLLRAIMYFLSGSIVMIYITQFSQICSFAIIAAASVYFTGLVVEHEDLTTGQAFMSGMMSAGTVLGSLFGGAIIDHMGMRAMLTVNIMLSVIGTGIAVCSVRMMKHMEKYRKIY